MRAKFTNKLATQPTKSATHSQALFKSESRIKLKFGFKLDTFQYSDYNFHYRSLNRWSKFLYKDNWKGYNLFIENFSI